MSRELVRSTVIGCALLLASAPLKLTHGQAWLPLSGEGQITITYENLYVRDHFDYTGKRFNAGPIRTNTVVTTFEYGLTNKLTLDSELTHVTSKYEGFVGPVPHGPPDTGFYHPTFQDLRVGSQFPLHMADFAHQRRQIELRRPVVKIDTAVDQARGADEVVDQLSHPTDRVADLARTRGQFLRRQSIPHGDQTLRMTINDAQRRAKLVGRH